MIIIIEVKKELLFTTEEIADLMVTALEGGINYWCGEVVIKTIPDSIVDSHNFNYASDILANGGVLTLHDSESSDTWDLTLEMFLKGLKQYCEAEGYYNSKELMECHDATTADMIVQYAIFGEQTFA